MTTAENLNRIIQAKSDIKQAIENKGVTVGDITINGYAAKINEIQQEVTGGSKWVVPNNIQLRNIMLQTLDVNNWDLSSTKYISNLFAQNRNLVNVIGINNWDVRKLIDANDLFSYCTSLETMDLSNWNILEALGSLSRMFYECKNIYEVNISNIAKNGINSTMDLFYGCTNLQTVYMKNWDLSDVNMLGDEFYGCTSLKTLDMENTILSNGLNGAYVLRLNSCTELENVVFGKQALGNWDFSYNTKLTRDSLLSIIDGLGKHPSATFTLKIGSSNLSKITEEDIAVATAKGWTITA